MNSFKARAFPVVIALVGVAAAVGGFVVGR